MTATSKQEPPTSTEEPDVSAPEAAVVREVAAETSPVTPATPMTPVTPVPPVPPVTPVPPTTASELPATSATETPPVAAKAESGAGKPGKPGKGAVQPNNVRKMRQAAMMSKAELARRAGVSPLTIDRVESGCPCRMDTKRKILEALGVKPEAREQVFGPDIDQG